MPIASFKEFAPGRLVAWPVLRSEFQWDSNPSAQDCEVRAILGHPPNHRLSQNPFLTVQNRTRTTSVVLENEIF
jgi:hypothetical protein